MASNLPLERLDLETMASGHPSLRLTELVTWEEFPSYATAIVSMLGGTIVDRADSPAERVWSASIRGQSFWIAFDDFGLGIALDPKDDSAGRLIEGFRETLLRIRSRDGDG